MSQIAKSRIAVLLSGLFAVAPMFAQAAAAPNPSQPNAGTLLDTVRDKDFAQPQKMSPGLDVQQEAQPAMKPAAGFKTKVAAFHITGSSIFTEAQLRSRVAYAVGQELTLAELEKVAAEISRFYRGNGYFVARAYLPAQEIKDGVVEIAVLEGRIGNVDVKLQGKGRLSESTVKRIVGGSAKPGDVINESSIERGLLLANDLAGVNIDSTLVPGAAVGTSDLVVDAKQTGTISGGVDLDASGNKYTGSARVGASVNVNNPARVGDQLSLRVMTSGSGMRYGRAAYTLPLGPLGTKIGGAYSSMSYALGGAFAAANAHGDARVSSLFVIHPLIRSRNLNLYGQVGYDGKQLSDKAGTGSSDKRDDLFTAGASGDSRDGLGGGGMNSFSATIASGLLDLTADPSLFTTDANSTKSNGSYTKGNYSLARMQRLTDNYSIYAALSGQAASKNLDSSEKFVLGGPSGIRGYPAGEASGDYGNLINLELRRDMGDSALGNVQLVGFLDAGQIQLHRNLWNGWQPTGYSIPNTYSLAGFGVGVNLNKAGKGGMFGDYSVKAFVAGKLGTNPGRDVYGNDSDGASSSTRFWLQASKWF